MALFHKNKRSKKEELIRAAFTEAEKALQGDPLKQAVERKGKSRKNSL